MRLDDIHVGDLLRVRSWEDMLYEFGSGNGDVIGCRFGFPTEMQHLCGKVFEVGSIADQEIMPSDMSMLLKYNRTYWHLSADMLEPCVPISALDDFEDVDLSQFLEVPNET